MFYIFPVIHFYEKREIIKFQMVNAFICVPFMCTCCFCVYDYICESVKTL